MFVQMTFGIVALFSVFMYYANRPGGKRRFTGEYRYLSPVLLRLQRGVPCR